MKILFTGGGTGGHIFPIIAIVRESKQKSQASLYFVGPKSKMGEQLLKNEGMIVKTILAGKMRRYFSPIAIIQNFLDTFKIPFGYIQAFWYLRKIRPNIIFSKGGYGALPVIWANKWFKIPVFVHEADVVPGLATRISAKYASEIFTSFENTETNSLPVQKIVWTGNPIRQGIVGGSRGEAKKLFELTDEKPVVLILGGSQGAERINQLVLGVLTQLLEKFEIIHQCGEKKLDEIWSTAQIIIKEEGLIKYYHPVGFLNEEQLKQAYAASHLIVSRAGSGAIFEIAAVGKPSILLPLPEAAQDHQAKNANAYAATGAAVVMESKNPTPALLLSRITSVFSQPEKLQQMAQSALTFAKPHAAQTIAERIIPSGD